MTTLIVVQHAPQPLVDTAIIAMPATQAVPLADAILLTQVLSLLGSISGSPINVLIDNGCSKNFVSTRVMKELALKTVLSPEHFEVELADGFVFSCSCMVPNLAYRIQQYRDQKDFEIMPLSWYDMILGQQWLYEYDPMIRFRNHSIHFLKARREYALQGLFDQPCAQSFQLYKQNGGFGTPVLLQHF